MISLRRQLLMKLGRITTITSSCQVSTRIGVDFHRYGNLAVYCVSMGFPSGEWKVAYKLVDRKRDRRLTGMCGEIFVSLVDQLIRDNRIDRSHKIVVFYGSRQKTMFQDKSNLDSIANGIMELLRVGTGCESVFIDCSLQTECRLFDGYTNAPIGFTVDTSTDSFLLVPHVVKVGMAKPIHCRVLKRDEGVGDMDTIKRYVFEQCNEINGKSQRVPAALIHTMKMAELLGCHFGRIHTGSVPRLAELLHGSSAWWELLESGQPFYL